MEIQSAIEIQDTIADALSFVPFAVAFVIVTVIAALMLASHPHFRRSSFSFAHRDRNSEDGHPSPKTPSVAGHDFDSIPFSQLMDGVDEFYKDFRNKRVATADAWTHVRDQLSGKSHAALERELKHFRAAHFLPKQNSALGAKCKTSIQDNLARKAGAALFRVPVGRR